MCIIENGAAMLSKALVEMAFGLPNVLFAAFFAFKIEGLCCKPKSRANIIHHFIFVSFFFLYFFYHSSCRNDQFTVLSLKFGTYFYEFMYPPIKDY